MILGIQGLFACDLSSLTLEYSFIQILKVVRAQASVPDT